MKEHSQQILSDKKVFPPLSTADAEQQLELLEAEFQKMMWDSQDKEKKSMLFSSLYQCNMIILECKKIGLEAEYQKELLKKVLFAEENEKEKIAKTIHDEFGLSLTALKIQLSFLQDQGNLNEQQKLMLKDNLSRLDEMSQTIRAIAEDLAPPTLKYLGYFKSIEALCAKLNCSKLQMSTSFPSQLRYENEREVHLFRITQELINNIIKHTKATKIFLNYVSDGDIEEIRISYNDRGISSEDAERISMEGRGSGLQNIIGRAQLISAEVRYDAVQDGFSLASIIMRD